MVFFTIFSVNAGNQNISNFIPNAAAWDAIFPHKDVLYSYSNFIAAVDELSDFEVTYESSGTNTKVTVKVKSTGATRAPFIITTSNWSGPAVTVDFEDFCNTGNNQSDKRELAAFFANISQETTGGWKPIGSGLYGAYEDWGLSAVEENGKSCTSYKTYNGDYPAVNGKCYYGRGPIQLSWNYNYGRFSDFLYGDERLLNNPDEVHTNGVTTFKSAIWFWMTPQCPKPSCHQVMQETFDETVGNYSQEKMEKKGFLHTVNIINGGVECRNSSALVKVNRRAALYGAYMEDLGFTSSEVSAENLGEYSTLCATSLLAMTNYSDCAFKESEGPDCSTPNLGADQTLCSASILLNAGLTLAGGETVKWFKDNIEIGGATAVSYSVASAGTYRAVIYSTGCSNSDEVIVNQGGSIQAAADNGGNICVADGIPSVEITVTGGGGSYQLYDAATTGNVVSSGSSFMIDETKVPFGQSKTFYVDEPAGQEVTVGLSERPTNVNSAFTGGYDFANVSSAGGWNSYRSVFTAESDITLKSVDFDIANLGNANPAELVIEVYKLGGLTLIGSKTVDLASLPFTLWDQVLYTVDLDLDLSPGQYELSVTPSNCALWISQYPNGTNFDYDNLQETGIASLDGMLDPSSSTSRGWGIFQNSYYGFYNWTFSTGGGASISCGRVPVTVTNNCANGSGELAQGSFSLYPNPAQDIVNVSLNGIKVNGAVVELFNQVGQVVISKTLNGTGTTCTIQTNELDAGVYFVKVTSGNDTYNANVVITK